MRKSMMVVAGAALGVLMVAIGGAGDGGPPRSTKPSVTGERSVIVDPTEAAPEMPKVWIGVRLTLTPESLNAHLGRAGLMIANIVSDSPADRAGFQRYDVVVSAGGNAISEMQELTDAIVSNGTGKPLAVVVLRGGKEVTLNVTPADRPRELATQFKFEEPEPADASPDVQYFGHRFQRDPSGHWILEPLGKLPGLPDDVKDSLNDLTNPAWNQWQDVWKGLRDNPIRMRIQPDADDDSFLFFYPDGAADDAQVEIRISVDRNGEKTTVHRAADGSVSIERIDADGNRSETKYDSMDALRESDPEAYKTYRQFSGYRSRPMITLPPDAQSLEHMQRDFQEKIQKALEKAREQSGRAMREASKAREHVRAWQQRKQSTTGDGTSMDESVSLTVEDGRIKLSIAKDGDTTEYEFESAEEFKSNEPELYEKYGSMISKYGGKARSQIRSLALAACG